MTRLASVFVMSLASATLLPLLAATAQRPAAGPVIVASDEPGDRLVLLSMSAGEPIGTIPVGGRPRGMALSPDGRRIYVALGKDDAVGVVDLASRHVVRRLAVGKDPEQVAVSPDGKTVYVSNEEIAAATAVDVASRRTRFTSPVGKEPEGVAVSPDARKLYVTGESDSSVTVLDAATGRRLHTLAVGARPRFENIRVACQQAEIRRSQSCGVNQTGALSLGQRGFLGRCQPGQPIEHREGKFRRLLVVRVRDNGFCHGELLRHRLRLGNL